MGDTPPHTTPVGTSTLPTPSTFAGLPRVAGRLTARPRSGPAGPRCSQSSPGLQGGEVATGLADSSGGPPRHSRLSRHSARAWGSSRSESKERRFRTAAAAVAELTFRSHPPSATPSRCGTGAVMEPSPAPRGWPSEAGGSSRRASRGGSRWKLCLLCFPSRRWVAVLSGWWASGW